MLKRLKNLWKLTEPETFRVVIDEKTGRFVPAEPLGDGKAEFLGDDMTEEEMLKYEHEEVNGWKRLKRAIGLV